MKLSKLIAEIEKKSTVFFGAGLAPSPTTFFIHLNIPELLFDDASSVGNVVSLVSITSANFTLEVNYVDLLEAIRTADNVKDGLNTLIELGMAIFRRSCANLRLSCYGEINLNFSRMEVSEIRGSADKYIEAISLLLTARIISVDEALVMLQQINEIYALYPLLLQPNLSPLQSIISDRTYPCQFVTDAIMSLSICSNSRGLVLSYVQKLNAEIVEDVEINSSFAMKCMLERVLPGCFNFPIYLCNNLPEDVEMELALKYPTSIDIKIGLYADAVLERAAKVSLAAIKSCLEKKYPIKIEKELITKLDKQEILELLSYYEDEDVVEVVRQILDFLSCLPFERIDRANKIDLLAHIFAKYAFVRQEHFLAQMIKVVEPLFVNLSIIEVKAAECKLKIVNKSLTSDRQIILFMPEDAYVFKDKADEFNLLMVSDNLRVKVSTFSSEAWPVWSSRNISLIVEILVKAVLDGEGLGDLKPGNIVYDLSLSEHIIEYLIADVSDISSINSQTLASIMGRMLEQSKEKSRCFAFMRKFNFCFLKRDMEDYGFPPDLQREIYDFGLSCLEGQLKSSSIVHVPEDIAFLPIDDAIEILDKIPSVVWNLSKSAWVGFDNYNSNKIIALYFSGKGKITDKISNLIDMACKNKRDSILYEHDVFLQVLHFGYIDKNLKFKLRDLFVQERLYEIWGWGAAQLKYFLHNALHQYGFKLNKSDLIKISLDLKLEENILSWYQDEINSWSIEETNKILSYKDIVMVPEDMGAVEIDVVSEMLSDSDKVIVNFDCTSWRMYAGSDIALCGLCALIIQRKIEKGMGYSIRGVIGDGKVFSTYFNVLNLISNIREPHIAAEAVQWAVRPGSLLSWGQIRDIIEAAWGNAGYFPFYLLSYRGNHSIKQRYVQDRVESILKDAILSFPESFLGMKEGEIYSFLTENNEKVNLEINEYSCYWEYSSIDLESFLRFKRILHAADIDAESAGRVMLVRYESVRSSAYSAEDGIHFGKRKKLTT